MAQRWIRLLKRSVRNARLNPVTSSMGIVTLTLCLLFLGVFFVLFRTVQQSTPAWLMDSRAVVYLRAQTSSQELEGLVRNMKQWPAVQDVCVVSAEDAMKRLETQLNDWKGILAGLQDNPLPSSLEITFKGKARYLDEIPGILEKIRQFPQVEDVYSGKNWTDKLEFILSPLKYAGVGVTILLALAGVMVVFHTNRLAVLARRDELEIYNILGATPLYTKIPFYVEGFFQGAVGGALAAVLLFLLLRASQKALPLPLAIAMSWKGFEMAALILGVLGCGLVFGGLGSWLALRRCLQH